MNISTLIEKLKEIKEKHGDCLCDFMSDSRNSFWVVTKVDYNEGLDRVLLGSNWEER